jgi:4-amino-4-deoxy-L-arabinose transferase-like glycosyltransferase
MIFGMSGVSVVLPQIIAGILSVPVLYSLVKRYFGLTAGLIAAFALAGVSLVLSSWFWHYGLKHYSGASA